MNAEDFRALDDSELRSRIDDLKRNLLQKRIQLHSGQLTEAWTWFGREYVLAQELGDEAAVVEKVVKFHSRILCRQIPRNHKASELYTGDITVVEDAIVQQLRPLFEEKGLALDSFGIREITFSPDYVEAIEQKQIEKEKVITEQYRAEQAKYRKQATITEAEGEAESIKIKGAALKENPDMVQLEFVRSLRDPDSKVKVMVIPSEGVLPLLDLGSVANATD